MTTQETAARYPVEDLAVELSRLVSAEVITPTLPGFEQARRVWNGMIDRYPSAIVRAEGPADITAVVQFARTHRVPLAIRGGGHNVAGNGTVDGGIVLDLGQMRSIQVDAGSRTARIGPGATLADVDAATEPYGLAVPMGVVSSTGLAGLALGGGIGWLTRAHGLSIDNVTEAEVVTAAGRTVKASKSENPELFWGIRGGGGNFGVISSFTFQAHPMPAQVFAGNLVYRRGRWTQALTAFAEWSREVPESLTSIVTFMVPPASWELGDQPLMLLGFAWAGANTGEAERAVAPMRAAVPPDLEVIEPVRWKDWQTAADELFPHGVRAYWKNTSFDRLDTGTIETIVRRAAEQTWRGTGFDIHHMGGAFGRVDEDATAFPGRSAEYWLNIYGYWGNPADDAKRTAFVRGFAADMAPYATGQYVNFMGAESNRDAHRQALALYGPTKLERLTALKQQYDPENVFRVNQNIPPAG